MNGRFENIHKTQGPEAETLRVEKSPKTSRRSMDERFIHLPQVAPAIYVGAQSLVGREELRQRWVKQLIIR